MLHTARALVLIFISPCDRDDQRMRAWLALLLQDPGVTRRVLDYLLFMNSKTLFKRVRLANTVHVPLLVAPQRLL